MIRVVKLGGSLLSWAEFPAALRRLLAMWQGDRNRLIVGGGAAADFVREMDRSHRLAPEAAHDLAILAMTLSGRAAAAALPEVPCGEAEHVQNQPAPTFLNPATLVPWIEQRLGASVPRSWDVTSDSLAALAARALGADELALLKSCPPPGSDMSSHLDSPSQLVAPSHSAPERVPSTGQRNVDANIRFATAPRIAELIDAGYVDRYFATASAGLVVRLIDLRSADLASWTVSK